MKKLIALKSHYYGRDLVAGDQYEAADEHAGLLVLLGQAKDVKIVEVEVESSPPKSKRQYLRRDLEAEK